jgi:hypothetical protein
MTSPQIAETRGPVFITVINTSEDVAYQERSENISRLWFTLKSFRLKNLNYFSEKKIKRKMAKTCVSQLVFIKRRCCLSTSF